MSNPITEQSLCLTPGLFVFLSIFTSSDTIAELINRLDTFELSIIDSK
jgi:hypothetical protein